MNEQFNLVLSMIDMNLMVTIAAGVVLGSLLVALFWMTFGIIQHIIGTAVGQVTGGGSSFKGPHYSQSKAHHVKATDISKVGAKSD